MELLIIPLVLAIGAYYLNRSERNTDREISTDRQKEEALQTYLDQMADLLLKKNLRTSENEEVRNVGRTRTLTVLRGLDKTRKGIVLKYLHEAGLVAKEKTIISLRGADLSGAFFWEANLVEADLRGADLRGADLSDADLSDADLSNANLNDAYLSFSLLFRTNLSGADLSSVHLMHTFFVGANLSGANLSGANLSDANLSGATMPDGTKHD